MSSPTPAAQVGWIIGVVAQTGLMVWAAVELWGSVLAWLLIAMCALIVSGVLVRASKAVR